MNLWYPVVILSPGHLTTTYPEQQTLDLLSIGDIGIISLFVYLITWRYRLFCLRLSYLKVYMLVNFLQLHGSRKVSSSFVIIYVIFAFNRTAILVWLEFFFTFMYVYTTKNGGRYGSVYCVSYVVGALNVHYYQLGINIKNCLFKNVLIIFRTVQETDQRETTLICNSVLFKASDIMCNRIFMEQN